MTEAHWIMINPAMAKCSACGNVSRTNGRDLTLKGYIFYAHVKTCPYCGAKMVRGKENESAR